MKHKMESKLPGNVSNLKYADDTTLIAENKEELKNLLMKVKENEKAGLKLNIQKMKIIASGPITSWQIYNIYFFAYHLSSPSNVRSMKVEHFGLFCSLLPMLN